METKEMNPQSDLNKQAAVLFGLLMGFIFAFSGMAGAEDLPGIRYPVQITYETASIQSMAVSRDGTRLLCTMEKNGLPDLWLFSADPQRPVFPRRITHDSSLESAPAFSPDGRFIAYTGTNYDVKGDIYLLNIEQPDSTPQRLTGRETGDGGACFDPSGSILYFHQILPGEALPRIASIRLNDDRNAVRLLETGTDGSFPAVSPDGQQLCYISYQDNPTGAIMLYNVQTGEKQPLTNGSEFDTSPVWSTDGKTVFFTRVFTDTDFDGKTTPRDNAVLFKVAAGGKLPRPYPMTRLDQSIANPRVGGGRLFYLSPWNRDINNCYIFPETGMIPDQGGAVRQLQYATRVMENPNVNLFIKVLAFSRVMEFAQGREAAQASYRTGKILEEADLLEAATAYYQTASMDYGTVHPTDVLARIAGISADIRLQLARTAHANEKFKKIESAITELKMISAREEGIRRARADIETARLLLAAESNADTLTTSIRILDSVIHSFPDLPSECAEARIYKAEILRKLGREEQASVLYQSIIREFPEQTIWVQAAVDKTLDYFLQSQENAGLDETVLRLRELSDRNEKDVPALAAGALNRAADLFVIDEQWSQAKQYYRLVLDRFPVLPVQTAAARLALAEILYREERFREALNLYATELELSAGSETIVALARRGYIRKSIASGEYLYRIGEVPTAINRFRELIDFEYGVVEAHRGYIKCAAALHKTEEVLKRYRADRLKYPDNPVPTYGTALLLTYQDTRTALLESKELLDEAISMNGQIEYFHQTRGYVYEVLETVYGDKGSLEFALESYKKAYFLNDYQLNPENRAHLSLNIANSYYNLNQFSQALKYYTIRLEAGIPFDNPDTEILFYQRLGASAFQSENSRKTIAAFQQAVKLIQQAVDPWAPVRMCEKIHRFAMDEIIMPADKQEHLKSAAQKTAVQQAGINRTLTAISDNLLPPPSDEWNRFRKQMEDLLFRQERIYPDLLVLLEKNTQTDLQVDDARQRLEWLTLQARKSLQHPSRMIMLKAEMHDRLGLAFQENKQYQEAADQFEIAFDLNQRLGQTSNLAVNRRSVAYNQYLQSTHGQGDERRQLLEQAVRQFESALNLVDLYGVASGSGDKGKEALLDMSLSVALDKKGATQAAHGFSLTQEKRLIAAFLSRINIELGRLTPAEAELRKQLAEYPMGKPVEDKDLYGVSLLYHRAGLLAAARQNDRDAFSFFEQSARLSRQYGNPVSTCINVMNMAHVYARFSATDDGSLYARLSKMESQAFTLLQASGVHDPLFSAGYCNTIGQYHLRFLEGRETGSDGDVPASVSRLITIQDAVSYLDRGLHLLTPETQLNSRKANGLRASLHLNTAIAGTLIRENQYAIEHFNQAAVLSEENLFPDIQWRALAGLGRYTDSLNALSDITIMRAGCRPFEIINGFDPLVSELVRQNQPEDAFNLIERLSELERFNRLAFLFRNSIETDNRMIQRLVPRIERIRKLRTGIAGETSAEQRVYLKKQLLLETGLVEKEIGREGKKLPEIIRRIPDRNHQESCIVLLGTAAAAEDTADRFVREIKPAQKAELKAEYQALIRQYHAIREQMMEQRPEEVSADVATFLGPEPSEAMDVMAVLSEEQSLVRLFLTDTEVWAFTLTPEEITLQKYTSLDQAVSGLSADKQVTIACESPDQISGQWPCCLSGTHFYRSMIGKQPFKDTIVSVPDAIAGQKGYQVLQLGTLREGSKGGSVTLTTGMNTLWLTRPVGITSTVPTRAQEKPDQFVAVENQNGNPEPITAFLADARNLSLAVLTDYSPDDIFVIGNLFSLYQCPSLLLARETGNNFSGAFLDHYRTNSVLETVNQISSSSPDQRNAGHIRLLGTPGMTSGEADEFLQTYFVDIVKKGKTVFDQKQPGDAVSYFRNALEISQRFEKFQALMPKLMAYCRESAYQANDLEQAAHYAGLLADFEASHHPDSESHAEALLRFGLILSRQEKFVEAISLLDEAVTILENLELDEPQVTALSELGKLLEHATEYDRALKAFETAAEISDNTGQEQLLADQYMNTGRIYDLRLSRYAAAIRYYQKALSIYRDMEEEERIPQVLLDIGRCFRLLGNFPRADEFFQDALALVEQNPAKQQFTARILIEQANNAWFQARYEKAFIHQRRAYEIAVNTESPLLQEICLNTSGLIWWSLGNHQKAGYELDKALAIAEQIPNRKDEVASTLNNIGLVLRESGRYEKALATFDKALAIDEKLQSQWAIAYDLRNKALTLLKMKQTADAVPLFENSAARSREIGNKINEAKALLGLADALRDLGRFPPARKSYQEALALAVEVNLPETQWRSIYGLAILDLETSPDSAEKLLRSAIDVIESMRADIKIEQLKESFSDNKFMVYETLVRLLADKGKPKEAFEIAERSRARGFVDLLGNRHLKLNRETDQHLYDRQNRIRIRMDETRANIAQSTETGERETYRKMLADLEHEYQDLLLEIASNNPQLASMVSVNPLTASDIMNSLDAGMALLSYYVLDNEVFCWLIRKGNDQDAGQAEMTLYRSPINRKQFETDILAYRRIIQNLEPFETQSQSLFAVLLQQPAAKLEGIRNIGIIPHGSLHYLSFATLFNGNRFVIDDYRLFYLPSVSVWKYTKGMRGSQKNIQVLAIGNPDLGDPSLDLPFAEHEVESIQWNFPHITVLTKEKASEEWVAQNIGKFGIIHIASHGEFDPVNPLFSAIKLSHTQAFDGNLETSEIFSLPVNADMVVLSACQSGLGKVTGGDDVIGLNRAFFYAGTHTVVSSLWRVSDVATAMLIKTFYRRYAAQDKSASLRSAMLHVKNRYLHPGYWGAFTLVGDYR